MIMLLNRLIGIFIVLCLIGVKVKAQSTPTVTASFEKSKFDDFVKKIELLTNYKFYYNHAALDSFPVTINAINLSLSSLLDQVFGKTDFNFAITEQKQIFVTNRKFNIITSLPKDIFTGTKRPDPLTEYNTDPDTSSKQLINTSAENKLYEIGLKTTQPLTGNAVLVGYVRDIKSGEAIAGASVYLENSKTGIITDQFGFFTISLPKGRNTLRISSTGMKATKREIVLYSSGKLNIDLKEDVPTLKTVVVVAERNSNTRRMQMGVEKLSIKTIKSIPVLFGEPDVLRVLLTLPGVSAASEVSTGFNVRGGSSDQNLILFNDATIYNPSHLFGLFSAFNPDIIKNAELYKSSIPEKYGGRLSSVLDVTTRDGNNKKWNGTAGIGLLTSKLMLEGPLKKDKTSLLFGGRTSYSDWLLNNIPGNDFANSKAYFYDLNLHLTHIANPKNTFYVTAYKSFDKFRLNDDTTYSYSNENLVAKWKHNINNKLFFTLTGGIDHYKYSVRGDQKTIRSYELGFNIRQFNAKADFTYNANNMHQLSFGVGNVYYQLEPGEINPVGPESKVVKQTINREQAHETAIYFGDKININSKLSLNAGLRYSLFNLLGPGTTYSYLDGFPRDAATIKDSIFTAKNKSVQKYHGPEFRLSLRYILTDASSIKLGYNSLRQYIHLLSNTTAISPTDIWKLSDAHIKPQRGDQLSMGYYHDFRSNTIETSIEVYYKRIRNFLDYKSGATLVLNQNMERDVINTKGRAYGAEMMIRKSTGKLNGWLSYTYSRTELKMDDSLSGQQINKGNYYPANFDKPHSVNLVANYKFTHRYSMSMNVVYSTGRPITLPIAIFNLAGSQRVFYSERNQFRVPDYFRMDLAFSIEGNHKVKQKTHGSWSFGVYNLTSRKNPYSIYFIEENGLVKGYKLSVIGSIIPYITYNIRF